MIPKSLFLDTGCFLARELSRDQYHQKSVVAWKSLLNSQIQLYCSEHVLDESITLLARRHSYAFAAQCGANYLTSNIIEWLVASENDLSEALRLMRKYSDQAVSYTDCISFVLMKKQGIRHVFGFDGHFAAARFRLWPD